MTKAKAAAQAALALDPSLAEPYATLAYRAAHFDWDWDAAETHYLRSFELSPNYAMSHHWYSHLLTALGRTDESLAESRRCLELDPLDLVINIHMAWHYQFARQYDEAVEQCRKTEDLHPNSFWPPFFFALAYEQLGKVPEAIRDFNRAIAKSGNVTFTTAGLGHLYGMVGEHARAAQAYRDLLDRGKRGYVPAYDLAVVCAGRGRTDEAFEWLDRAYDEKSGWLAYLKVDPRMDRIRSDGRIAELLKKVRLAS